MRTLPHNTPTSLHALTSQVSGHPRVLTTRDGLLIIKLARPIEREFYKALVTDPKLAPLRPFIPKFFGTLWLEGQHIECEKDPAPNIVVAPGEIGQKESIMLQNLAHGFLKPNVLDIKLGTVFYDDATSPAKVKRVQKTARETTSWETGMRLTAFQVYDNNTSLPIDTPKSYGKSIKPYDLPEGFAKFFPVGTHTSEAGNTPTETLVSDPSLVTSIMDRPINSGLPCKILLPILRAIRSSIVEVRTAYASLEIRMVGASMLIMYESDWERAEEGLRRLGLIPGGSEVEFDNVTERNGENGEEEEWRPYVVKLIDFAHAKLTPGAGPDQGVLKGMDTIIDLLDDRIHNLGTGNR